MLCNLHNKNNGGFTLIELLVVISIISILSIVILVSVKDTRDKAKMRKFESELVQLRTAIQLYRESNNGEWPNALKNAPMDDSTSSKPLIVELNNKKLFSANAISMPSNNIYVNGDMGGLYIYHGPKTNPTDVSNTFTCGNPENNDVYYALAITSNVPLKTNIPPGYWGGYPMNNDLYESHTYCIEIK